MISVFYLDSQVTCKLRTSSQLQAPLVKFRFREKLLSSRFRLLMELLVKFLAFLGESRAIQHDAL